MFLVFGGYFGHFLRFRGCIRLFLVSSVFWTFFFVFTRAIWSFFFRFMGVFWSHLSNWEYFGLFRHKGYFGYFHCFGGMLVNFRFWGLFWSFSRFRGCIGLFLGIECVLDIFCIYKGILVIFCALWGYFGLVQVIEGILIFFRHGGYFVHFQCFGEYFSQFLGFRGYFNHLLGFKGV